MEIKRLSVKDEVKIIEREETRLNSELHQELFHEISVKGEDPILSRIPEITEHVMLKLRPDEIFDHIEEEYNKVKDFDFSKIDVKEIRRHIKNM